MATAHFAPERIAVVAFIGAEPFRSPETTINGYGIHCFQNWLLIMVVGAGDNTGERVATGVTHHRAFYPRNSVFAGVAALSFAPLFDLTTEASK